ncbi:hypothetical protein [Acinetobacter sp. ANC 3791]|uniref:hypothetical protein n=1 Tax=Acinetobacter sp. ANC 3791 TaxID=2529836 RepID=UPI00103F6948|nr:hypothetical protein [Acinetobacter sp. ANC 3791]TCB83360.1 hypothetical protein E0H90_11565 [Acinetobacter sp. ANC 3791]
MPDVRLITITEPELESLIDRVCRKAILDAFAQKDDELLNIEQLCKKIPGLTRHLFKKLANDAKLKNVRGKYSFNAVKAAMQSH